MHTAAKSWTHA